MYMEKGNEDKADNDKETIIEVLERIAEKSKKAATIQKKLHETEYYKLKTEYMELVKITPFPTAVWDRAFEEDSIGKMDEATGDANEDRMLSWVAYHFIECVVDRKTVGPWLGDKTVSLFRYATMSDFAYLVQVLEQYRERWFHLAVRSLKCEGPPTDDHQRKAYNEKLRVLMVYGVGKNGLSSEEGQERNEIIMDYLFENVGGDTPAHKQRRGKINGMYINLMEEFKKTNSSVLKARKEEYASESEEDKNRRVKRQKRQDRLQARCLQSLS